MRVIHATDCYLPRRGGIELHVQDLATHQRRKGIDARVITATAAEGDTTDQPWVRRLSTQPLAGLITGSGRLEVAAELEAQRPDAVHVHVSVWSPFAAQVARQATRLGLPTLVTVHSMWNYPALSGLLRASLQLDELPVLWSAVSNAAAERVRSALGAGSFVSVLPNAVEPEDWARQEPRVSTLETHGNVEPQAPRIVSVMRLARRKRPLPFLHMLRIVRATLPPGTELRATIIGDGPQRAELERSVARHGMGGWVELPGQLDRSAIREQFARSSLYVAPAKLESFGIAALEARCAGLPIVASSRGGVGEFITDGVDGVLAPDDAAMTAAMVRLCGQSAYQRAIFASARQSVPDLGWDHAVTRSLDAYNHAAGIAYSAQRAPLRATAPGLAGVKLRRV